jgi:hypothetical protein
LPEHAAAGTKAPPKKPANESIHKAEPPPDQPRPVSPSGPRVEPIEVGGQEPPPTTITSDSCTALVEGPSGVRRRLYSIPSRSAPSFAGTRAGDRAQVLESRVGEGATWYRIRSGEATGWILAEQLDLEKECKF